MGNFNQTQLDTVAELEALLEASDIDTTRHIFLFFGQQKEFKSLSKYPWLQVNNFNQAQLDTVAELDALLEASDTYTTRRIFLFCWPTTSSRP